MLANILLVIYVIFSVFLFSLGIELGIQQPIWILSGVISIFLFYLLINLGGEKLLSGISVKKDSIIGKIKQNQTAKIFTITLLWILAIGNFTYANYWIGTPILKGAEYLDAALASFISFVILSNKVKSI